MSEVAFILNQVDAPGRAPGVRHIAELVDDSGFCTVPFAVAWLSDFRPTFGMVLDFLIVPDVSNRRHGFATRLFDELERRFPDLTLTEAISAEGEAFLEFLEKSGRLETKGG